MCDAHLVIFLAKSYKNAYPKSCTHALEKWFEKTRPFVWGAHKVCSSLCSPNQDAWENEQAIFCNHATLLQKIIKDQIQRNPLRYLQSIYPPNGVSFPSALKEFPPLGTCIARILRGGHPLRGAKIDVGPWSRTMTR